MRTRSILAVAPPVAIALALGAATPASAATIETLPCVKTLTDGPVPVPVRGAGFTAGSLVTVAYVDTRGATQTAKTATVDANGNFGDILAPASYRSGTTQDQKFTLVARDAAGIVAQVPYRQVKAGFSSAPNASKPTSRVKYTARGWETGRNVYAHFRFGGKTRRDVKLGKAKGPCGIVSKRMRALPAKIRYGTWTLAVDQKATYSASTVPQSTTQFRVFRRFL